jgi:hypothetical protein
MAADIVSEPRLSPFGAVRCLSECRRRRVLTGPVYGQKALGIEVPSGVLSIADEVIE